MYIYIYTFEWCMIIKIKQQNHTKIQSKSIPPSVSYIPTAHPRHFFPPSSLGSPKNGLVFEVVRRNYQSRNASVTPPAASVRPPSKRRQNFASVLLWVNNCVNRRIEETCAFCCRIFAGHVRKKNRRELQLHWFILHIFVAIPFSKLLTGNTGSTSVMPLSSSVA